MNPEISDKQPSKNVRNYIKYKEENPDFIVLFQEGFFYNTLFDDAITISKITGATIFEQNSVVFGKIPKIGIKKDLLNTCIKKLLDNSYKLCVYNQITDENSNSKTVLRKYTKGTLIENEFLNSSEYNFIATCKKTNNVFQFCYGDVSTGELFKTTCNKKEILDEILKINPQELLISSKDKEFFSKFNKLNLTILSDEYFENKIESTIIKYFSQNHNNFAFQFNNIKEYKISNYMILDNITRKSLEITRTRKDSKRKGSIFWFLNFTKTPMGNRALKKIIDEPLLEKDKIIERQKALEEIISNKEIFNTIEATLENIADLSRLCSHIDKSIIKPKDLIQICKSLFKIRKLVNINNLSNSELLKINTCYVESINSLLDKINLAINEEYDETNEESSLIKIGYDTKLDYLKNNLDKHFKEISKLENKLTKQTDCKNLSIKDYKTHGFLIEIPNSINVPNNFTLFQSLKNCSRYKNENLKKLEIEINDLRYKIKNLEREIFADIKQETRSFITIIRSLSQEIANIDALYSFAKCSMTYNLSKPIFKEENINIKNGYHPSLIKLNYETVKNDTDLKENEFMILTGANMSGKSTYIKHNALIALLAQIGCYIPAQYAQLSIIDKIFFRQGSTDDILNNNSSFMIEMNDLKYIIDNATKNSLILLDEPARSTSQKEGGAIVKAFIKYVIKNKKAKGIIATHNQDITQLENELPKNCINYSLGNPDDTINNRKLTKGIAKSSQAIQTAILAQLPNELIEDANLYLKNN